MSTMAENATCGSLGYTVSKLAKELNQFPHYDRFLHSVPNEFDPTDTTYIQVLNFYCLVIFQTNKFEEIIVITIIINFATSQHTGDAKNLISSRRGIILRVRYRGHCVLCTSFAHWSLDLMRQWAGADATS